MKNYNPSVPAILRFHGISYFTKESKELSVRCGARYSAQYTNTVPVHASAHNTDQHCTSARYSAQYRPALHQCTLQRTIQISTAPVHATAHNTDQHCTSARYSAQYRPALHQCTLQRTMQTSTAPVQSAAPVHTFIASIALTMLSMTQQLPDTRSTDRVGRSIFMKSHSIAIVSRRTAIVSRSTAMASRSLAMGSRVNAIMSYSNAVVNRKNTLQDRPPEQQEEIHEGLPYTLSKGDK